MFLVFFCFWKELQRLFWEVTETPNFFCTKEAADSSKFLIIMYLCLQEKKCRTYINHLFHIPLRTWYSCQNFGFVFVGERNNMEIHYKGILLNCISSSWQEIIALFIVKQKAMWSKEQKEHYQHELVQRIQRLINTLESAGNVAFLLCSNLPTSLRFRYTLRCMQIVQLAIISSAIMGKCSKNSV